ncbi:AI-2E family transporter [Krasilnikovia cinnamomea]|uniref:AI-2E family transporter n=1 Tax=Krasilnikovia cinnamomea TaxID=349313 RepID=UPI001F5EB85C|nr:AI-2E family transporter [Krasilnikovia cinnamomea]
MLVFRWAMAGAAGVLVVLAAAYGLYSVRGILMLVVVGLFVAVSLDPAVRWLVARGLRRSFAVSIVVLGLVALFGLFVWSFVPPLVEQTGRLSADLPGYLTRLSEQSRTVREVTDRFHLTDRLAGLMGNLPARLAGGAVGYVQKSLGVLASSLTVLVLSVYFMADMPRLQQGVVGLFAARHRPVVARIVDVVVDKVGGYMTGNIAISMLAGASAFVCLELVGVPFALPLAVAVAIADLIPMIGATLGAVICLLVSVLTVGIWPRSVIVLAFFVVYQQVENYLIAPRVMRSTVNMSSVAVLLAALTGGAVLGVVGAIMAVPVAATIKLVMTPRLAAMHGEQPREAVQRPDAATP